MSDYYRYHSYIARLGMADSGKLVRERADKTNNRNNGRKTNLNNTWDHSIDRKVSLKLAIYIFSYIYSQDDQIISKDERNKIRKLLKKDHDFTSDELVEIFSFVDLMPTLSDVLNYISNETIDQKTLDYVIDDVQKTIQHNNKYFSLLSNLKKSL
jgi:ATP-dependent Lon protease